MSTDTNLVKAIVARGRSIDIPFGEALLVGKRDDGRPLMRSPSRTFHAGEEVELPADEVASLMCAGYLVDPASPVLPAPVERVTKPGPAPQPYEGPGNALRRGVD